MAVFPSAAVRPPTADLLRHPTSRPRRAVPDLPTSERDRYALLALFEILHAMPSPRATPPVHVQSGVKRRKVRKGTHSCWECKRRKMKCVFESVTDSICIGCRRRDSQCVSQEYPEVAVHKVGSHSAELRPLHSDSDGAIRDAATQDDVAHTGSTLTGLSDDHGSANAAPRYMAFHDPPEVTLPISYILEMVLTAAKSIVRLRGAFGHLLPTCKPHELRTRSYLTSYANHFHREKMWIGYAKRVVRPLF